MCEFWDKECPWSRCLPFCNFIPWLSTLKDTFLSKFTLWQMKLTVFFSIYDCTRELSQIKNSHSILKYKMPSASVFTDWTNLSPVVSISIWICWEEFVYLISEKLMSSNDTLNLWGHHRSLSKADDNLLQISLNVLLQNLTTSLKSFWPKQFLCIT